GQAKFTTPEIKEFGELELAQPIVLRNELELDPDSAAEVDESRVKTRNMRVLNEYLERDTAGAARRVHFRFFVSPDQCHGEDQLERLTCVVNALEKTDSGYLNAVPTDETFEIETGLLLRSVGYKGIPLPSLPYENRKGTIPNDAGRVRNEDGSPLERVYVAGWAKRGPSGIIGTNKACAVETVRSALDDLDGTDRPDLPPPSAIAELLGSRGVPFVTFDDWN